jgi:hypothetical protein
VRRKLDAREARSTGTASGGHAGVALDFHPPAISSLGSGSPDRSRAPSPRSSHWRERDGSDRSTGRFYAARARPESRAVCRIDQRDRTGIYAKYPRNPNTNGFLGCLTAGYVALRRCALVQVRMAVDAMYRCEPVGAVALHRSQGVTVSRRGTRPHTLEVRNRTEQWRKI